MTTLPPSATGEYCCQMALNLYKSPECKSLVTQVAIGRCLQLLSSAPVGKAVEVRLCEDGYSGWLPMADARHLCPTTAPYQPTHLARDEIEARLPEVIAFTLAAMDCPNFYLWGGTIAPNYDCSGLMQAAFAASGIWLPRDSYQQEDFTEPLAVEALQPGDLLFFKKATRVSHVALYLGEGKYIHSSGTEIGRNGIGIDVLSAEGDTVSRAYYSRFCGAGRVASSFVFVPVS